MTEHLHRTCRFAEWQRTAKGNIRRKCYGTCAFQVQWPPVPICLARPPCGDRTAIWWNDRIECPVWKPTIPQEGKEGPELGRTEPTQ